MNKAHSREETHEASKKRLLSIDFFKGMTILLMVFVNTTRTFLNIPPWSKHAVDVGLTYVDVIAPFFLFMMALNFKISFLRRVRQEGKKVTYLHFIRRYVIFIVVGVFLTLGEDDSGQLIIHWGTLQVLGMSGLIALFIIELNPNLRLVIGILFLGIHQALLETDLKQLIYDGVEGGILAAFSWGGMMILSTVIAEGLIEYKSEGLKSTIISHFLATGIILTILGAELNLLTDINPNWIISRQYMSVSYCIITIGISALTFFLIFLIFDFHDKDIKYLRNENLISVIGKNAFALFIIHIVIVAITNEAIPPEIDLVFALIVGITCVLIIWAIGFLMNKYEFFLTV
ncbi:MAG: heparan-alpha-glucosaminide N-acetyltransferase domain-containing protein [Promethearchaeota archaeon]